MLWVSWMAARRRCLSFFAWHFCEGAEILKTCLKKAFFSVCRCISFTEVHCLIGRTTNTWPFLNQLLIHCASSPRCILICINLILSSQYLSFSGYSSQEILIIVWFLLKSVYCISRIAATGISWCQTEKLNLTGSVFTSRTLKKNLFLGFIRLSIYGKEFPKKVPGCHNENGFIGPSSSLSKTPFALEALPSSLKSFPIVVSHSANPKTCY